MQRAIALQYVAPCTTLCFGIHIVVHSATYCSHIAYSMKYYVPQFVECAIWPISKETYTNEKRPMNMRRNPYQKRPTEMKRICGMCNMLHYVPQFVFRNKVWYMVQHIAALLHAAYRSIPLLLPQNPT